MRKAKFLFGLLQDTMKEWSEDKAPRLAAALSYYTVFALAPFLIIVITLSGLIFSQSRAQERIFNQIGSLVGTDGEAVVRTMVESSQRPSESIVATILGVIVLIFGASGLFGQLQEALNTIWEVMPKPGRGIMGIIRDRFFSFTMVMGVAFLLLVSLVISAALAAVDTYVLGLMPGVEFLLQVTNFVVSLVIITVLFALIFKILPDARVEWGVVWPGALLTALLFTIGKQIIGIYLGNTNVTSAYGAAGALVLILLWVYYSAQILFFGAEFTQVYAKKLGHEIIPDRKAVRISEAQRIHEGIPHTQTAPAEYQPELPEVLEESPPAQKGIFALGGIMLALVSYIGLNLARRDRG